MSEPSEVEFVVRRVRPHEGRALRELRLRALADSPSAFGSTHAVESAHGDEFWTELARKRSAGNSEATFVAETAEGLVAMAGGFVAADDGSVHLVSMWTAPEARRRRVASALIAAVAAWARGCGAHEIHIWVTCGNDPARKLYGSHAFASTGEYQPLPSDPSKIEERMRLSLG